MLEADGQGCLISGSPVVSSTALLQLFPRDTHISVRFV